MEITVITRYKVAELTVESGNTKIAESMTIVDKFGNFIVPQADIEQLITAANELSRFNGISDVEFVEKILDAFLTGDERLELLHNYCQYCGQNKKTNGECYCSPKFDE